MYYVFMKLYEKIKSLNKSYSYNIFALIGIFILTFKIFCILKNSYTYDYAVIDYLLFPVLFLLTFIIYVFELIFQFKIKNERVLNNKIINIVRFVGVVVSIIYLLIAAIFIFCIFVTTPSFS